MSFVDEIAGALHSAERLLSALGPKPKGDVAGLKALAAALRAEASTVASEASAATAIPRGVVFTGPGRAGLDGNAAQVGGILHRTQSQLESAADRVTTQAAKIDREQKQWARDRHRLEGQIASLGAQLRNAK